MTHVSGKRMTAQGTDGLSRGQMREGISLGKAMSHFGAHKLLVAILKYLLPNSGSLADMTTGEAIIIRLNILLPTLNLPFGY